MALSRANSNNRNNRFRVFRVCGFWGLHRGLRVSDVKERERERERARERERETERKLVTETSSIPPQFLIVNISSYSLVLLILLLP